MLSVFFVTELLCEEKYPSKRVDAAKHRILRTAEPIVIPALMSRHAPIYIPPPF
jgi:hypothetical protein